MFYGLYNAVVPDICCLCDDNGLPGLDLCAACYNFLPHNNDCCYQCAAPLPGMTTIFDARAKCGRCLAGYSDIDQAIVPFLYRPPVDYMIKKLKFSQQTKFSRTSGELIADAIIRLEGEERPDVILPVPVHHDRLVQRGYNQAEMIARTTARRLETPVLNNVLTRTVQRLAQSSLSAREREKNIKRAFAVTNKEKIQGLQVAIVDDVYTTGATARAIATHLKRAGVTQVSLWAFARTP